MGCPICTYPMMPVFTAQVLGKYSADFENCQHCGFLRIANPDWLEEAYSSAIAATDTGLVMRNIAIARKLAAFLYFVLPGRGAGSYLDEAGGYGMLTRLMRDYGFDFYWSDKYCANLLARGFELENTRVPFQAVTAFEAIEHVVDPLDFVRRSLNTAQSETFIFTTELFRGAPPLPDQWSYYSLDTGQHISFFNAKSLHVLAETLNMKYYYRKGLHVFTRINLSPIRLKLFNDNVIAIMMMVIERKLKSKRMIDHESMVALLSSPTRREG